MSCQRVPRMLRIPITPANRPRPAWSGALWRVAALALCGLLGALLAGCEMPPTATTRPAVANAPADPCAERMHDLCGALLLYYMAHHDLPPALEDLAEVDQSIALSCPATRRPYEYVREGLNVRGETAKLILFEPIPCHAGLRCGILCQPSQPGKPLVLRVARLQDRTIVWPDLEQQPANEP